MEAAMLATGVLLAWKRIPNLHPIVEQMERCRWIDEILIWSNLSAGETFRLAQAFGVFDLVQVLTGGGPAGSTESIALYAYLNGMRFLDFGYSATVMLAGFLLLTALILAGTLLLRSFGLLRSLDR